MHNIKIVVFVTLIWGCVFASRQAMAQASATFALHISLSNPAVKNGADEVLLGTVTNISNHDIKYGGEVGIEPFKTTVRDEQGNPVKETKFGMQVHDSYPHQGLRFSSHFFSTLIKKGGTISGKGAIGKEYDFSVPGTYSVYISQMDGETGVLVTSNTVHFTVLPK